MAVQWPALGLILWAIHRCGRLSGLSAIPVHGRASVRGGAVFPGAPGLSPFATQPECRQERPRCRPRGWAPVTLRVTAVLGMWRVIRAMKSKDEKCFSLPLKYSETQDFQVTVSCS